MQKMKGKKKEKKLGFSNFGFITLLNSIDEIMVKFIIRAAL